MNIVTGLIEAAIGIFKVWYASEEADKAAIEAEAKRHLEELAELRIKLDSAHDARTAATRAIIEEAKKAGG